MRTAAQYREIIKCLVNARIIQQESPYNYNKWESSEVTDAKNEGYLEGLREVVRILEESEFLLDTNMEGK